MHGLLEIAISLFVIEKLIGLAIGAMGIVGMVIYVVVARVKK